MAATDTIELALGAGKTLTVTIHVLPITQNTAPTCEPTRHAQRTDGQGQEVLVVTPRCHDAERDSCSCTPAAARAPSSPAELTGGYATYWLGAHLQYRTAAATGTEAATYWAVDELGARSQDAPITLAFGPDANLPAECYLSTGDPRQLVVRPGIPRNFGVYCQDPEEDAFTLRLGTPPWRGVITAFAPEPVRTTASSHRSLGISGSTSPYFPGPGSTGSDEFTVLAESAIDLAGDPDYPPERRRQRGLASVLRARRRRSCRAGPVDIETTCVDAEGDPVQAWITTPPVHGTAEPPVVAPGRFGHAAHDVPLHARAGSGGRDRVGITLAGFGELFFEVACSGLRRSRPAARRRRRRGRAPPPPGPPLRSACARCASRGGRASRGSMRRGRASGASAGGRRSRSCARGAAASARARATPSVSRSPSRPPASA